MIEYDRETLAKDALHVLEAHDPAAQRLARLVLAALDDPMVMAPEGYALVRRPVLLEKGVPAR